LRYEGGRRKADEILPHMRGIVKEEYRAGQEA